MVRREIAHGNGGRSHRLRKHCRWRFLAFFESRCFLKVRPLVAGGVFMRWVLATSRASRVFPEPQTPVRVSSWVIARVLLTSTSSRLRPTKLVLATDGLYPRLT